MQLRFVYKVLPAFIFYTDWFPEKFGGMAFGPIVLIRPKYKDRDEGLVQHELTHVKQWCRTLGLSGVLYRFSQRHRVQCEVEAYRVQASYYTYDATPWMAKVIHTKYDITKYTEAEILNMLRQ